MDLGKRKKLQETIMKAHTNKVDKDKNDKGKRATRQRQPTCGDCGGAFEKDDNEEGPFQNGTSYTKDYLICNKCDNLFHFACGGVNDEPLLRQMMKFNVKWICFPCKYATLDNQTAVQTKLESMEQVFTTMADEFKQLKKITNSYELTLETLINRQTQFENNTDVKINSIQQQINELQSVSNSTLNQELTSLIDQLKLEIQEIKNELENNKATNTPKQSSDINYIKNLTRRHNIIIEGVPIMNNEDDRALREVIKKIGGVCGIEIKDELVVSVRRLKNSKENQPGLILLKCAEQSNFKDEFLSKYFDTLAKNIPLKASMIGFNTTNRIYFNHHLSKDLLTAKGQALILKHLKVVQKVIPRYNFVKIVLNNNESFKINSSDDLRENLKIKLNLNLDDLLTQHRKQKN